MHRRSTQRVFLSTRLKARLGSLPAAVVDLGVEGAGLEHRGAVKVGDRLQLAIDARHPIRVAAIVRHSKLLQLSGEGTQATYHTGVEFPDVPEDQIASIDSVLIDEAKEKLAEWEANLTGTRRGRLPSLSRVPSAPHAYEWHQLAKGEWTTRRTPRPESAGRRLRRLRRRAGREGADAPQSVRALRRRRSLHAPYAGAARDLRAGSTLAAPAELSANLADFLRITM